MGTTRGLSASFLLLSLLACGSQNPEGSPSPKSVSAVPPQAPDTVPSWVLEDTSYTTSSPQYLKHTIGLAFHAETSRDDRQAAVDAVGGEVVGGWRHGDGKQGLYVVRVNDDDSAERLREMREKLRAMPQVKAAIYILAVSTSGPTGPGVPDAFDADSAR